MGETSLEITPRPHSGLRGRSFSKDIAELLLFYEVTGRQPEPGYIEATTVELARNRGVPGNTLKRCASEARALVDFAHESGALEDIRARARARRRGLHEQLAIWIDEVSLPEILRWRSRRLNRRYGGRPVSRTRTLRAVAALAAIAREGREEAIAELQAIRDLVQDMALGVAEGDPAAPRGSESVRFDRRDEGCGR